MSRSSDRVQVVDVHSGFRVPTASLSQTRARRYRPTRSSSGSGSPFSQAERVAVSMSRKPPRSSSEMRCRSRSSLLVATSGRPSPQSSLAAAESASRPHRPSSPWRASSRAPQPSVATLARSAATASAGSPVRSRITCHRIDGSESSSHSMTFIGFAFRSEEPRFKRLAQVPSTIRGPSSKRSCAATPRVGPPARPAPCRRCGGVPPGRRLSTCRSRRRGARRRGGNPTPRHGWRYRGPPSVPSRNRSTSVQGMVRLRPRVAMVKPSASRVSVSRRINW